MKKFRHISFRLVCVAQVILTTWFGIISLLNLFQTGAFIYLLQAVCYFFICWLPVFALSLFSNNYPDKPVVGSQKKIFNRLFILNFLLTSFLFAFVFQEYRSLSAIAYLTGLSFFEVFPEIFVEFVVYIGMLIFHLLILYGLYQLRISLADNFTEKKFEFEK